MSETIHTFESRHLGNSRPIWLRSPKDSSAPCNLAIILDAEFYRERMDAVSLLDRLERSTGISNTLFVFVSHRSLEARWTECPCHAPFADFINSELVSWLEQQFPQISPATKRVLIGLSYTGLAAAFVALQPGSRFSHVIAQSGSFWSNDCWLTEQVRLIEKPPTAFYLDIGNREIMENVRHKDDVLQKTSQIEGVKKFRDALTAKGWEVVYREFNGGHEFACWKETLPDALMWALPPG